MLEYVKRNLIAFLALFVALGGTSYAAVKLPKNSVGSTQIRKGAVTESKLAKSVQAKVNKKPASGAAGAQGPKGDTGAPGPKGDTGPEGPQGLQGVEGVRGLTGATGPTDAGIGGINVSVTPGQTGTIGSSASVTLAEPGRLLVIVSGTLGMTCSLACNRSIGAEVQGGTLTSAVRVPGAFATVGLNSSGAVDDHVTATGILSGLGAGTYSVTISTIFNGVFTSPDNDLRVVAVALGNG